MGTKGYLQSVKQEVGKSQETMPAMSEMIAESSKELGFVARFKRAFGVDEYHVRHESTRLTSHNSFDHERFEDKALRDSMRKNPPVPVSETMTAKELDFRAKEETYGKSKMRDQEKDAKERSKGRVLEMINDAELKDRLAEIEKALGEQIDPNDTLAAATREYQTQYRAVILDLIATQNSKGKWFGNFSDHFALAREKYEFYTTARDRIIGREQAKLMMKTGEFTTRLDEEKQSLARRYALEKQKDKAQVWARLNSGRTRDDQDDLDSLGSALELTGRLEKAKSRLETSKTADPDTDPRVFEAARELAAAEKRLNGLMDLSLYERSKNRAAQKRDALKPAEGAEPSPEYLEAEEAYRKASETYEENRREREEIEHSVAAKRQALAAAKTAAGQAADAEKTASQTTVDDLTRQINAAEGRVKYYKTGNNPNGPVAMPKFDLAAELDGMLSVWEDISDIGWMKRRKMKKAILEYNDAAGKVFMLRSNISALRAESERENRLRINKALSDPKLRRDTEALLRKSKKELGIPDEDIHITEADINAQIEFDLTRDGHEGPLSAYISSLETELRALDFHANACLLAVKYLLDRKTFTEHQGALFAHAGYIRSHFDIDIPGVEKDKKLKEQKIALRVGCESMNADIYDPDAEGGVGSYFFSRESMKQSLGQKPPETGYEVQSHFERAVAESNVDGIMQHFYRASTDIEGREKARALYADMAVLTQPLPKVEEASVNGKSAKKLVYSREWHDAKDPESTAHEYRYIANTLDKIRVSGDLEGVQEGIASLLGLIDTAYKDIDDFMHADGTREIFTGKSHEEIFSHTAGLPTFETKTRLLRDMIGVILIRSDLVGEMEGAGHKGLLTKLVDQKHHLDTVHSFVTDRIQKMNAGYECPVDKWSESTVAVEGYWDRSVPQEGLDSTMEVVIRAKQRGQLSGLKQEAAEASEHKEYVPVRNVPKEPQEAAEDRRRQTEWTHTLEEWGLTDTQIRMMPISIFERTDYTRKRQSDEVAGELRLCVDNSIDEIIDEMTWIREELKGSISDGYRKLLTEEREMLKKQKETLENTRSHVDEFAGMLTDELKTPEELKEEEHAREWRAALKGQGLFLTESRFLDLKRLEKGLATREKQEEAIVDGLLRGSHYYDYKAYSDALDVQLAEVEEKIRTAPSEERNALQERKSELQRQKAEATELIDMIHEKAEERAANLMKHVSEPSVPDEEEDKAAAHEANLTWLDKKYQDLSVILSAVETTSQSTAQKETRINTGSDDMIGTLLQLSRKGLLPKNPPASWYQSHRIQELEKTRDGAVRRSMEEQLWKEDQAVKLLLDTRQERIKRLMGSLGADPNDQELASQVEQWFRKRGDLIPGEDELAEAERLVKLGLKQGDMSDKKQVLGETEKLMRTQEQVRLEYVRDLLRQGGVADPCLDEVMEGERLLRLDLIYPIDESVPQQDRKRALGERLRQHIEAESMRRLTRFANTYVKSGMNPSELRIVSEYLKKKTGRMIFTEAEINRLQSMASQKKKDADWKTLETHQELTEGSLELLLGAVTEIETERMDSIKAMLKSANGGAEPDEAVLKAADELQRTRMGRILPGEDAGDTEESRKAQGEALLEALAGLQSLKEETAEEAAGAGAAAEAAPVQKETSAEPEQAAASQAELEAEEQRRQGWETAVGKLNRMQRTFLEQTYHEGGYKTREEQKEAIVRAVLVETNYLSVQQDVRDYNAELSGIDELSGVIAELAKLDRTADKARAEELEKKKSELMEELLDTEDTLYETLRSQAKDPSDEAALLKKMRSAITEKRDVMQKALDALLTVAEEPAEELMRYAGKPSDAPAKKTRAKIRKKKEGELYFSEVDEWVDAEEKEDRREVSRTHTYEMEELAKQRSDARSARRKELAEDKKLRDKRKTIRAEMEKAQVVEPKQLVQYTGRERDYVEEMIRDWFTENKAAIPKSCEDIRHIVEEHGEELVTGRDSKKVFRCLEWLYDFYRMYDTDEEAEQEAFERSKNPIPADVRQSVDFSLDDFDADKWSSFASAGAALFDQTVFRKVESFGDLVSMDEPLMSAEVREHRTEDGDLFGMSGFFLEKQPGCVMMKARLEPPVLSEESKGKGLRAGERELLQQQKVTFVKKVGEILSTGNLAALHIAGPQNDVGKYSVIKGIDGGTLTLLEAFPYKKEHTVSVDSLFKRMEEAYGVELTWFADAEEPESMVKKCQGLTYTDGEYHVEGAAASGDEKVVVAKTADSSPVMETYVSMLRTGKKKE